ncbi:MAG: hypothetical protein LBH06_06375 [Rikenellaceae bacterium]|jgi:hypothetical protein|nr:hypothetical protein [Rikenellaceae bacterium]
MRGRKFICALAGAAALAALSGQSRAQGDYDGAIEKIAIVSWTHTDYGFTEHPLIVAELQKRYIDVALDAAAATRGNRPGERFTWTVEALDPFLQWWNESSPSRRRSMVRALREGQIDLNIMPFNIHPMFDASEMDRLLEWLPADVAAKVRPSIAIQNDVNGFPRSAVSRALDRGVRYVWMGMNGRHPFHVPTLSRWEMPDGRHALLWSGVPYWAGYDFFHATRWRTLQREAAGLQYRWPRDGEFFRDDEQSVREAHAVCIKKLSELEQKWFRLKFLPLTFSNQWRCDNDGPYPSLVSFVQTWNRLGLRPSLVLSTATSAMEELERGAEEGVETIRGEFGDWWAFGLVAMPRETAVARKARYMLKTARSPLLGGTTARQTGILDRAERDVCVYYEHTFASYDSGSDIYGLHNQGTMNEAFRYAYKAYEQARWVAAQKARARANREPEGIIVMNTQKGRYSGWCSIEKASLRERKGSKSLLDTGSGKRMKLYPEGDNLLFWIDDLPGESLRRYVADGAGPDSVAVTNAPEIVCNGSGWPVSIKWEGMSRPLFDGEAPTVYVSRFVSGGWWGATAVPGDCFSSPAGPAQRTETPHSIVYRQKLSNERLNSLERAITVYKGEPRVNVKIVFDRTIHSRREPEVIYAEFPLPATDRRVTTTNGGMEYEPYRDNLPNTCKTFFVADSWVKHATSDGVRVWASKTSPIFELGRHMFFRGGDVTEPDNSNLLQSMLYNNGWGVNFPVEYGGETVCEYDIYWQREDQGREATGEAVDAYLVGPTVVNNPGIKENALYNKWLNDKL